MWLMLRDWISGCYGHIQYHHLHTNFHPNWPITSEVIRGFLYIHLGSLNVRHFGMAEATSLKGVASRLSSMADRQTWRQTGYLIIPFSFFESRLKSETVHYTLLHDSTMKSRCYRNATTTIIITTTIVWNSLNNGFVKKYTKFEELKKSVVLSS
jgi:hypothetical protein